MKRLPTLYKIDSKGRTRTYEIKYDDTHFITYAGLQDRDKVANETYPTPKGKNTLAEQVEKEAKAKYRKKYERELYSEDLSKPHPLAYIEPMHALDYTKVPHRAKWDKQKFVTQPKLNGVRCIVQYKEGKIKLTSRKGKEYTVPHIQEQFLGIYNKTTEYNKIYDGELYIHDVELGDVTHAVAHGDKQLTFRLFDLVDNTLNFQDRYNTLHSLPTPGTVINLVPCAACKSEIELKEQHDYYVSKGYEGAMLRDINALYTSGKRTPGMFKYKHFQDEEFEIVNVAQDKTGGAILILKIPKGLQFNSRPKGSNEFRDRLWKERKSVIGKFATVRYSELLKTGLPEFNRTVSIRDYE